MAIATHCKLIIMCKPIASFTNHMNTKIFKDEDACANKQVVQHIVEPAWQLHLQQQQQSQSRYCDNDSFTSLDNCCYLRALEYAHVDIGSDFLVCRQHFNMLFSILEQVGMAAWRRIRRQMMMGISTWMQPNGSRTRHNSLVAGRSTLCKPCNLDDRWISSKVLPIHTPQQSKKERTNEAMYLHGSGV